jgi:hypothetical protein
MASVGLLLGSAALVAQGPGFTYTMEVDGPSGACVMDGNRANGINQRGDIAGRCANGSGPLSWVWFKGSSTPSLIDFSSAPFLSQFSGTSTTRAIDSAGDIVGRWFDFAGHSHGYLLTTDGFVSIDVPQALSTDTITDTDARGVNNPGTIIGFYSVNHNFGPPNNVIPGIAHGFVLRRGTFTAIDYPGAVATLPRGLNDAGDVVGWYITANTTQSPPSITGVHGFIYSKDVYTSIDVPSSFDSPAPTATILSGINEQGQIAGDYTTAPVTFSSLTGDSFKVPSRCFVRSADGSTFTHIDVPNALSTDCRGGINDHGNIVGTYVVDASGTEHGFETSR